MVLEKQPLHIPLLYYSFGKHQLIADKMGTDDLEIIDIEKFKQLKKFYDSKR
ncbi:hypothetical protein ADICYQ_0880 [Cyclobacterium qasimii M12-11B]|uniref:Uncharacterized protein n=2 Tax=Cyclobacterium qasimii TaxID=1350429 RepID=S7WVU1_9BACT|nr:hypothetical protein ADICYQ_0880 [Cyclobacterium qasimii M12-11B]GEO23832.1 hypothetical protein CQA01_43660 [Cyclobacterium qasimii]